MIATKTKLFPEIETSINTFRFESIPTERINILQPLIDYIQQKTNHHQDIRLNLICTHNSRRSILAQVWAQTAAAYYNIENVNCYSGGTEATALYPMIVKTLEESGFKINTIATGSNPIYTIKYAANSLPLIGFSKVYDNAFNPESEFAAIMTCTQADSDCPFISGAEKRIPIAFEDPKEFDNTQLQKEKYEERNLQIATEMLFVFSQIKK